MDANLGCWNESLARVAYGIILVEQSHAGSVIPLLLTKVDRWSNVKLLYLVKEDMPEVAFDLGYGSLI